MRADRLIALMMLLQARGKMTARELAAELEVSERTIYRDIDALSVAGVPLYADRGPGGGCGLLNDYRTQLTGLTETETQAIFMLHTPAALAALDVDGAARSALLKLAAALPVDQRADAARVRQRVHVDPEPWFQTVAPIPSLRTIYHALFADRKLELRYQLSFGAVDERTVNPYGLVAKSDQWYFVYGWQARPCVLPVDKVLDVRVLDELCDRPADFDLGQFWDTWSAVLEENRRAYTVTLFIAPQLVGSVAHLLGVTTADLLPQIEPPDASGRAKVTLPFESFEAARRRVLGWGRAVEVLAPRALRLSVADYAEQIVALYADD